MLIRRFSIFCLVVALAGGGVVTLLQTSDRTPYASSYSWPSDYSWQSETAPACPLGVTRDCLRLVR